MVPAPDLLGGENSAKLRAVSCRGQREAQLQEALFLEESPGWLALVRGELARAAELARVAELEQVTELALAEGESRREEWRRMAPCPAHGQSQSTGTHRAAPS